MRRSPQYFAHPLTTVSPRDLLLLEHLHPKPTDVALEIGVGSGSSLFQLAGATSELHGLDIAEGPVQRVRDAIASANGPRRRLRLFVFDFCEPKAAEKLPVRYDLIYSCDTVEHVVSPQAFFANVYAALKPGGRAFVAFPNEHPDVAHGITFFQYRRQLADVLQSAGFPAHTTAINTLNMSQRSRQVLQIGWYKPRRIAKLALGRIRRLRQASETNRTNGTSDDKPQTFDQTDFYTLGQRIEFLAPLINAYCWSLLRLTSSRRPIFELHPAPDVLWNTTVLIRATRPRD